MDILNEEDQLTNLDLEIDSDAKLNLTNAAYWARFISIFIFSMSAFVVLIMVLVSSAFTEGFKRGFGRNLDILENFSGGILIVVLLIVFLFIAVVYYFLYHFGIKTKEAMLTDNIELLNKGLNSLKIYFIIMGVLGILGILTTLSTFTKYF